MPLGIENQKIIAVRKMTKEELDDMDWKIPDHYNPFVFVLENKIVMFPTKDSEWNSPGHFGYEKDRTFDLTKLIGETIEGTFAIGTTKVIGLTNGKDIYAYMDQEGNGDGHFAFHDVPNRTMFGY